MVQLFVLLSKGLDSYEANEHDGLEDGAWGAVLAQGFGGGAVSVLRLACRGTSNGGVHGDSEVTERSEQHEDEADEGLSGAAVASANGAEEGTHDENDEEAGDQDVAMEDVKQIAGGGDPRVDADGEDKVSGAPTPDTATSQSGKQGTRSKAAKEREGPRIICWEYPAPLP